MILLPLYTCTTQASTENQMLAGFALTTAARHRLLFPLCYHALECIYHIRRSITRER